MHWIQFLVEDIDDKGKFAIGFVDIKTCFDNFSNLLFGNGNNPQGNLEIFLDNFKTTLT